MNACRLHASVKGAVQGVGFRYFAIQAARGLGLTGFVRNARDGSVEVVAEGPRENLERLRERLAEGPRAGYVKEITLDWEDATGEFQSFDVVF